MLDAFAPHLPACACAHAFQGHDDYHVAGARRFIEHLRAGGVLPPIDAKPETVSPFIKRFSDWMRHHRGVTEATLTTYMPLVKEFVAALGDDPATYDTRRVRAFARASRRGSARAKSVVNAVRMFLRFLAVYGDCSPELIAAVPGIAEWKLCALPRYISANTIEQRVATCDPRIAVGARDRAVILLLARLGLRAGDVRDLRLADIDCSQGRLRVAGKGRFETWLALPQEVAEAVLHSLEHFRPSIEDDHVFLRVHAPLGPLPSSGPLSKWVRRAIQRAAIEAPSRGAHWLTPLGSHRNAETGLLA